MLDRFWHGMVVTLQRSRSGSPERLRIPSDRQGSGPIRRRVPCRRSGSRRSALARLRRGQDKSAEEAICCIGRQGWRLFGVSAQSGAPTQSTNVCGAPNSVGACASASDTPLNSSDPQASMRRSQRGRVAWSRMETLSDRRRSLVPASFSRGPTSGSTPESEGVFASRLVLDDA